MRSYLEVSERVFERGEKLRNEYIRKKKRVIALSSTFAACLMIGIAVWTAMENNFLTTNELISTDKEQTFTAEAAADDSHKNDEEPLNSSVSEEKINVVEEIDSYRDGASKKEQNPEEVDGDSVYFSEETEYNSSIYTKESGADDLEDQKIAGSVSQSSSVFMPAEGGVIVYNEIKEYCDKLSETDSDEKIPVRIDVYSGETLITDQIVLNNEKIRLEEAGLSAEIMQVDEQLILVAELTEEELQQFPGSEQNGYILRLYTD